MLFNRNPIEKHFSLSHNIPTMLSGDVQEPEDDVGDLRGIKEIFEHAFYLRTLYQVRSIGGTAKALGVTTRSVFNHIQWMQCLTGEKLLEEVEPGQCARLTPFGSELGKQLVNTFENTVRWLNEHKMDKVTGETFTEVIKQSHSKYRRCSGAD